jgi:uncharacterized protein YbbC (DUF1343 family)
MIRPVTFCLLLLACTSALAQTPTVKPGIETLRESNFSILRGKRVGLITNPTGVDSRLVSTIDILKNAPGVTLVALFAPEHGVRGDQQAGKNVETSQDPITKLPVYSLYGKNRKPTTAMLKGIDVLIYDIQDIGCRSYTFISTMGLAMDAAAENNIAFVVLDRPNPLGGEKIEGNLVEKQFTSFLGQFPIPYVYGLTCGELATLINETRLLPSGKQCSLTVIPMKGWKRNMRFEATGLPWVPTSPHMPNAITAEYYVCTGILGELGVLSEGVGYTLPFQTIGAPWINPNVFASEMNKLGLQGVIFRPITYTPFYGRLRDSTVGGIQIHITDPSQVNLMSIQFLALQTLKILSPERDVWSLAGDARLKQFDRVLGADTIRKKFMTHMTYEEIRPILERDVAAFRQLSKKYWLYK